MSIILKMKITIKKLAEMFFERRFPEKKKDVYFDEWVKRFESGKPEEVMDNLSKRIYWKLLNELGQTSPLEKPFYVKEKNTTLI